MADKLRLESVDLPGGPLQVWQLEEAAEFPDDAAIEWAPIFPYWSVLWRSGVALARFVDEADLAGKRVVELGCGMAVPSMAAARGGAEVLAQEIDPEGLALVERSAAQNDLQLTTVVADWAAPTALVEAGPFDLVLGSDILYERQGVGLLLDLLPKLAPEAWIADPGRDPAAVFLEHARERWSVDDTQDGVATIHRIKF